MTPLGAWPEQHSVRGNDIGAECLFSLVSCEAPALADHPRRPICAAVNEALSALSGDFKRLYARPSRSSNFASEPVVPTSPDKLLRTLLLQAFYSVRSERQLMELDYNLLFRWFVRAADGRAGIRDLDSSCIAPGSLDNR